MVRGNGTKWIYGLCISLTLFFFFPASQSSAANIYVDKATGDDAYSGYNWSEAKQTIAAALSLSAGLPGSDVVHVAEGSYAGGITLVEETTLLGGYPSGGGTRDPASYVSTITGGGTVVTGADDAVIDGFTITGGTGTIIGSFTKGGGIACFGTSPTIRDNKIHSNTCDSNGSAKGAGIYCENSEAIIENNTIQSNTAKGETGDPAYDADGGGICCINSKCTIIGNRILDNAANAGGFNSYFTIGGSASGAGGGIYCGSSECLIKNNTIKGNLTTGGYYYSAMMYGIGGPSYGGGVYCGNSSCTITGNLIEENTSSAGSADLGGCSYGGGIHCYLSNCDIQNNTIYKNKSYAGSGGWSGGGGGSGYGGGIYCDDSACNFIKNNIEQNGAYGGSGPAGSGGGIGGGIYIDSNICLIAKNHVLRNTVKEGPGGYGSGAEGGGIFAAGLTGSVRIENNVIGFNTVDPHSMGKGGGMVINLPGQIVNNYIFGNECSYTSNQYYSGCGLYCGEPCEVVNNIFNDNSWVHMGGNVTSISNNDFVAEGIISPPTIYCSTKTDCYTYVTDLDAALSFASGNIDCSPDFDPVSGYLLTAGSCCIDAGTSYLAPTEDIQGEARPEGAGYDAGVDEFYVSAAVPVGSNILYFIVFMIVFILGYRDMQV